MSQEQEQQQEVNPGQSLESCEVCGRTFRHSQFVDHLFKSRECMKRYWEEEEKTHVYRLRHHRAALKNSGNVPGR